MKPLLRGIDHIYLSVRDFDASEAFYDRVMESLGLKKGDRAIAGEPHAHYLAPAFQLSIRPARSETAFDAYRSGLHHLCFQADDAAAVDECYARLSDAGVSCTRPARCGEYHPEYYATFFEDPDGIRLEVVARTSHRDLLADRWSDLDTFLNPIARLKEREEIGAQGQPDGKDR